MPDFREDYLKLADGVFVEAYFSHDNALDYIKSPVWFLQSQTRLGRNSRGGRKCVGPPWRHFTDSPTVSHCCARMKLQPKRENYGPCHPIQNTGWSSLPTTSVHQVTGCFANLVTTTRSVLIRAKTTCSPKPVSKSLCCKQSNSTISIQKHN